ncbi:NAD(P)H-dependent oxidoreductase [Lacticaseibacillus nasuensis]|uniref:NAD(P)H-dependent oxidoreductase n=1 Tax=Lacticaseibacillus nasuensis TaxID=944671 RepID=UPI002247BA08|nr:NAD(P)H-dependent oxidoreductase [Lacticaseibacillus nasuensis]MCX2455054.1 FAD-binding protein [Lacticaseibacillus nasuensis]
MKLLAIVGNNATVSYNRLLLQYMKRHFAPTAEIELQEIKGLPLFNEDDLKHFPAAIEALIQRVKEADGVIIATPEYDHSMTASLKSVIEWLSASYHSLAGKPVMVVGASFGAQGTVRAQMDLRHVLDAPGVDAHVLPGNEFMLPNCKTAFDAAGNLKDQSTVKFLEECFTAFVKFVHLTEGTKKEDTEMSDKRNWDQSFDVVVLGFGGAGATAARFAADAGAKVLLVDSAPEGHEGGNTRYAGQLVGSGSDFDQLKAYYKALTAPMNLDEDMIDTYVTGMVNMPDYLRKYLGVEPFSTVKDGKQLGGDLDIGAMSHEFPEYPGANSYDMLLVHAGYFDSALWKKLRKAVLDRRDKITVWYSSPAKHLIQDPHTNAVIGAQIEHDHVLLDIQARGGVILATGGFENNPEMIQDYLKASKLAPVGSIYNKGDGVKMGLEVGADMWHMANYESLGMLHGLTIATPAGERGRLILAWPHINDGSVFVAGDDGSRYFNETEDNRHGHLYYHGMWQVPIANDHPHLIFDQTQWETFKQSQLPIDNFDDLTVKADTLEDLAKLINAKPDVLAKTRADFDHFTELGEDYAYGRKIESMRAFDDGPYYALPLEQAMLNTQGGPRRNTRAEVLAPNGKPIANLYSAGELGGINANQYQGGNNIAECLIWGKIAGENAAHGLTPTTASEEPTADATSGASEEAAAPTATTSSADSTQYPTGPNQYIGVSDEGMGNEIVVRVTYADGKLENVEVLKQSESADVGLKAIKTLPQEMVAANSTDVDAVSGASVTSHALQDAVADALKKAKATVTA